MFVIRPDGSWYVETAAATGGGGGKDMPTAITGTKWGKGKSSIPATPSTATTPINPSNEAVISPSSTKTNISSLPPGAIMKESSAPMIYNPGTNLLAGSSPEGYGKYEENKASMMTGPTPSTSSFGQPFFIPGKPKGTTPEVPPAPPSTWPGAGGAAPVAPIMPTMPKFEMPTWDEGEISSLQQQLAAPTLRKLRQQIREAQGKYYDNPNVKRMTLRDALAGYGLGVEEAMAGSRGQATSEYQQKYGREFAAEQTKYQGAMTGVMAQYQAAWSEYLARLNAQFAMQRAQYAAQLQQQQEE